MTERTFRVRTAHGFRTVDPAAGHVLPHEHILSDTRVWWEGEGDWRAFDSAEELAATTPEQLHLQPQGVTRENMVLSDWYLGARELRMARDSGTQLVVDLTVLGLGPNTEVAVRAADLAGLDVVVSVGRYLHDAIPAREHAATEDELVERWLTQITDGIDGYTPGIIGEIGTSWDIEDDERTALRAAARVQRLTGLPVNIHVHPFAKRALEAISMAEAAGADPGRIAVSHLDCEIDLPQLEAILRTGAYVEMDNFGTSRTRIVNGAGYPDDSERLDALEHLINLGFTRQLLLSHDINHRNSLISNGGWGYAHIGRSVIPRLIDHFGTDTAQALTVENPLSFLHVQPEHERAIGSLSTHP
jgi:phosphotriesterase-related protein